MGGSILLLILVLWKGKVVNHAQSWILGIQPAEFIKLGVVIVLSRFFAIRQEMNKPFWYGGAKIILFLSTTFILIYKQPNLGSAILIMTIAISIFLCSGININLLIKRTVLTSVIWFPFLLLLVKYGLSEVQKIRITTMSDPFLDAKGAGYQLVNSFIAIGSGGITGRGLGNSVQKSGYLPEPYTDFVMAILSEELGLVGVSIIMIGLLIVTIYSFRISKKCQDLFGSLIAIGIGSMIGFQSVVNVGGITGVIPLTGTPLPFVSFGGSSLITNLLAMGMLINISFFSKIQKGDVTKFIKE
ncbi:cell division protein FtsW [Bacillus thuringiensis serovar yunnanensis]|nr:cell division protein FtsW [Bacillus thuringiensis serovar yunnanensis]